ncbi:MAG: efflux RND transporter permease subunit, partial [Gammaproteobacteria bacterium]|nr:efflux RND transporter permease subunit [Gammaproteobacteria bacterium]
ALREEGLLSGDVTVDITGAADQLDATRASLGRNFAVAVALIYLVLVAIYSHWGYPLFVLATVPLGIAGGIGGLALLNGVGALLPALGLAPIHQSFDMITMLGFLILLGTVTNNPILIVDRASRNLRDRSVGVVDAVREAVESRIRPITMSTLTTVFGLAPLVLIPGAGTELYRGVGVVVLSGLLFSMVVTLVFLPSLLVVVLSRTHGEQRASAATEADAVPGA